MTAIPRTTGPTGTTSARRSAGDESRYRFRHLLAAEWLKWWTLRSIFWALVLGALAVVGINAYTASSDSESWPSLSPDAQADLGPVWAAQDAFTPASAMILVLVCGTLGAMALVGEHSSGLVRTTFAAVPARHAVVVAKGLVIAGVMALYGAVLAVASFGTSQAILAGRGIGLPWDHPGAARLMAASALLAPISAMTGLALGALIRHAAATLVTVSAVLLLLPQMVGERSAWSATVRHAMLLPAWEHLVEIADWPSSPEYPATTGGSWAAYVGWALVPVLLAVLATRRMDL
ncbi:ABC transporter permease [Streptomyces sp. 3MP-14]|uniref:ABC transporter permease n=1 Tax=Streptomyces mimosae TaxID=2586635 RepID=A0A5N6A0I4_9ACTN|nr:MULTISPECIES: ABC transporter permease [Streptomyces]KAB8162251.1 ABC transporter permease [Streptomyces mimosae]KAB8173850.1 ABC transporter permease [Streptomyces sp. 3MP-14]